MGSGQPKSKRNRIHLNNHFSALFTIPVVEEPFVNECG